MSLNSFRKLIIFQIIKNKKNLHFPRNHFFEILGKTGKVYNKTNKTKLPPAPWEGTCLWSPSQRWSCWWSSERPASYSALTSATSRSSPWRSSHFPACPRWCTRASSGTSPPPGRIRNWKFSRGSWSHRCSFSFWPWLLWTPIYLVFLDKKEKFGQLQARNKFLMFNFLILALNYKKNWQNRSRFVVCARVNEIYSALYRELVTQDCFNIKLL